jgi:hypothetical protein
VAKVFAASRFFLLLLLVTRIFVLGRTQVSNFLRNALDRLLA